MVEWVLLCQKCFDLEHPILDRDGKRIGAQKECFAEFIHHEVVEDPKRCEGKYHRIRSYAGTCPKCGRWYKFLAAHRKGNRQIDTVEGCALK